MNQKYNYLREFILFSEMDDRQLSEINKLLIEKEFSYEQTIFFEGEKGDRVYFLKKGRVKVCKLSAAGDEQILEIINSGDVFGEVVLFGKKKYPATAITMGKVKVAILNREVFKDFFYENPRIGWGMFRVMANKLYKSQLRIKNLGLRDARGRMAALLIELYRENTPVENNRGGRAKVKLDIKQQEMADIIGVSRETVSRTLGLFKEQNLISIRDKQLLIFDLEGLKKFL